MKASAIALAALLAAGALAPVAAQASASSIAAAVADPGRPKTDKDLDASRHPAEILNVLNIKPGQVVADVWPGAYWDRLFSNAVGPSGKVYAVHLTEADKAEHVPTPPDGSSPYADHPNIVVVVTPTNSLTLPQRADVIWIRQNYHDLYDPFMGPADVPAFNKAVFKALKPGGLFVVIDHSAPNGSGLGSTNTTHRIDEARVKADMIAAGFTVARTSDVLRNSADDRTKLVFDPSVKGKTDQFITVFRKP